MSQVIGSIYILTGSIIGAGLLSLPIVGAATGFYFSTVLLLAIWAVMTLTALLVAEATSAFKPSNNSYSTMARKLFNRPMQVCVSIAYLFMLYTSTAAYICGSASLMDLALQQTLGIKMPLWLHSLIFTAVFGTALYLGTKAVDYSCRFLLSAKGISLILMLVALMPYVDVSLLVREHAPIKYLLASTSIFLTAFGFHTCIPSISTYCAGHKPKTVFFVIIMSSTTSLVFYLIWMFISMGMIPLEGNGNVNFTYMLQHENAVGSLIAFLIQIAHNKYVTTIINFFADIAMTTSFLGITLGLFDFIAEGAGIGDDYWGRFKTLMLTLIPPVLFALFYRDGFIAALEYQCFASVFLEMLLPGLMVYRLRKHPTLSGTAEVPLGANTILIVVSIASAITLVLTFLIRMKLLPALDA